MRYALYYRSHGTKVFSRAGEIVKATRGRLKGTNIHKDYVFDTIESAKEIEKRYISIGYETKIKEVQ